MQQQCDTPNVTVLEEDSIREWRPMRVGGSLSHDSASLAQPLLHACRAAEVLRHQKLLD
jgi:hypothetical protein